MYRSTEIIQSFYQLNIPKEITSRILEIERDIMYKNSLYDWMHLSKECKQEKFRRFFYEDNHILFMRDIEAIDGDAEKLKDYRKTYHTILKSNHACSNHLKQVKY
tara:strand:- start:442 stop:756 length:315 start_codon:yes stop_codon:yes gene_type:complete